MYKILNYLKNMGFFVILIIIIGMITSIINITGFNNAFINKIGVILTALSFFIVSASASKNTNDKGYILGIKLGLLFIIILIITNLFVFKSSISIDRIIYYIILLASSTLGGSFGKNFKSKKLAK